MIIAVDFDGTCVKHWFPRIGEDIGAAPVLKKVTDAGHDLILFTMRSDKLEMNSTDEPNTRYRELTDAVNWFKYNNIPLWGIQENPEQYRWTSSPKVYANLYIDDAALGCPLIYPENGERPYVDWVAVEKILIKMNIIGS